MSNEKKTAEEILIKYHNNQDALDWFPKSTIIEAMEEYAQMKVNELNKSDVSGNEALRVAIDFAKWISKQGYVIIAENRSKTYWQIFNKADWTKDGTITEKLFEKFKAKSTDC